MLFRSFFATCGGVLSLLGVLAGVRYLWYFFHGAGEGHVQSLIFTAILILMGVQIIVIGLLADVVAANRKILEDVQYRIRRSESNPGKRPKT